MGDFLLYYAAGLVGGRSLCIVDQREEWTSSDATPAA